MIGVGINSNVIISSALINEKKTLEIELKYATEQQTKSVFDTLLSARTADDSSANGLKLRFFSPTVPTKEDMTKEQKIKSLMNDNIALIKKLSQILQQYMIDENITLEAVQFENTGIVDQASLDARYLDQDVQNKIYDNIVKEFVKLITPFVNNNEYALRFKLVRQSKDKHYATVPSRYITDNPFVELMSVPEEQSRVKFTKWELDNGFDSGKPIEQSTAEAKEHEVVEANPFAAQ